MTTGAMTALYVVYVFIALFVLFTLLVRGPYIAKKARKKVLSEPWLEARDFYSNWPKKGGLRDSDGLGCFIILVFDHPVSDGSYDGYENVFVGKAAKAYKGAYAQLAGHGSKDILRDFKDPHKYLYVQARFYDKDEVEKMERTLVGSLKAHKSYNAEMK